MAKIHSQKLDNGGLRLAYLAQPEGDIDSVVRKALQIGSIEASSPLDIAAMATDGIARAYIIEGERATVYHNPWTLLQQTTYTVEVPKDGGPVVVAIRSMIPMVDLIQIAVIDRELTPAGLAPIESEREQIPAGYLRATF